MDNCLRAIFICKQFSNPRQFQHAHFGQASATIWMGELACSGRESSVADCKISGCGKHDCHHTEYVGVSCGR